MRPVYLVSPPAATAETPRRWSFSSLAVFRECPRRWWLLNSRYSNTPDGRYPVPYGASALRGRLVHEAVETYAKLLRTAGEDPSTLSFSPRAHLKKVFREVLENADANPRTDPRRLSVTIDDCVRDFYDLVESQGFVHGRSVPGPSEPRTPSGLTNAPSEAAEFWVEVDDPPIGGIIDRVVDFGMIDFKTGEPSAAHAEQLVFYATLWWLRYSVPPRSLELRYTGGVDPIDVPVPSIPELSSIADKLRAEVSDVNNSLVAPLVPARPSSTNCGRCPVRQLCDEYWVSPETVTLRSPRPSASQNAGPSFCDARILEFPSHWPGTGHVTGAARADGLGEVHLFVEREKCPDVSARPTEARLLSAMVHERIEQARGEGDGSDRGVLDFADGWLILQTQLLIPT